MHHAFKSQFVQKTHKNVVIAVTAFWREKAGVYNKAVADDAETSERKGL